MNWRQSVICCVAGLTSMLMLSSCTYSSQFANRSHSRELRKGMTKDEVLALMGEPLRNQKYHRPDIWFYYIDTRWGWDFSSTRDECLPLVFKDGKLEGWGNDYYYKNIEATGRSGQAQSAIDQAAAEQDNLKKK